VLRLDAIAQREVFAGGARRIDFLAFDGAGSGGVLVRKRLVSWGGILLAILLLAALLGFPYLDRWGAEAVTRQGRALVNSKDYPAAIDHFSRAMETDPGYAPAYHGRGVAYLHQGERDRAIADFGEAIRLDPNNARARHDRGVAYFQAGDFDRALADFGEAIRLDPGYARAYLARSRAYAKKGDAAQAQADRQKAVELDPSLDKSDGHP
jgi:Flp pilus assembly protein TadD